MIGIILVSHSQKITEGLLEMINEMVGESDKVQIISAGGTGDGRLGTNTIKIMEAIEACQECEHILLFNDIGSAILSSETAIELIEDEILQAKVELIEAPLVEGAFAASIQASVSGNIKLIFNELSEFH